MIRGQQVYNSVWTPLTDETHKLEKTTNVASTLRRSTVAISERRIHISRRISTINLFYLMYSTILTFIKLNNYDTWRLNGPRRLFPSFCCTTRHIFEPLHVYEPGFKTDKYGIQTHIRAYIHTHMHTYIHTYTHTHIQKQTLYVRT